MSFESFRFLFCCSFIFVVLLVFEVVEVFEVVVFLGVCVFRLVVVLGSLMRLRFCGVWCVGVLWALGLCFWCLFSFRVLNLLRVSFVSCLHCLGGVRVFCCLGGAKLRIEL